MLVVVKSIHYIGMAFCCKVLLLLGSYSQKQLVKTFAEICTEGKKTKNLLKILWRMHTLPKFVAGDKCLAKTHTD